MLNKAREFVREVKAEVKKVVFPSRDELKGSTVVVIVAVLIISVYLGAVDLALNEIVKALIN